MSAVLAVEKGIQLAPEAEKSTSPLEQFFSSLPLKRGSSSANPSSPLYLEEEQWDEIGDPSQTQHQPRLALRINGAAFSEADEVQNVEPLMYVSHDRDGNTHVEVPRGSGQAQEITDIPLHKSMDHLPQNLTVALELLPVIQSSADRQGLSILTNLLSAQEKKKGISRRTFLQMAGATGVGLLAREWIEKAMQFINNNTIHQTGGSNLTRFSGSAQQIADRIAATPKAGTVTTLSEMKPSLDTSSQTDNWIGIEQLESEEQLDAFKFLPLYPDGINPYTIDDYKNYVLANGNIVSPERVKDTDLLLGLTPKAEFWGNREMQITPGFLNQSESYTGIVKAMEATYRKEEIDKDTVPMINKIRELLLAVNYMFPEDTVAQREKSQIVAAGAAGIYGINSNLIAIEYLGQNEERIVKRAFVAFTHKDRAYVADPAHPLNVLPFLEYMKEMYLAKGFKINPEILFWSIISSATPAGEYLPWDNSNWVNGIKTEADTNS